MYCLTSDIHKTRCGDQHYVSYMNVNTDKNRAIHDTFVGSSLEKEGIKFATKYIDKKN